MPNPHVALVLSIIPGLGQLYNREFGKGILFFFGFLIAAIIHSILALFVWIYGFYDAYTVASKGNEPTQSMQNKPLKELHQMTRAEVAQRRLEQMKSHTESLTYTGTQSPRYHEETYSLGTESSEESSEPFRQLSRAEIAERKLARMRDQTFKGFIFVKKGPDVADHIKFFRQLIKNHGLTITEDQPIGITWGIEQNLDFSHPITGALAQMQVASIVGEREGFEVDYSRTKMNVIDDREYGEILLIEMYSK